GKIDLHGQDLIGAESGIDAPHPRKALGEQTGCREQDDGDRDLGNDEKTLKPPPPSPAGRAGRRIAQRFPEAAARSMKRRKEADGGGAHCGDDQPEQKDADVEPDFGESGSRLREKAKKAGDSPAREKETDRATGGRQDSRLGQELPNNAATARPESD